MPITVKTPKGQYLIDTDDREVAINAVRNFMSKAAKAIAPMAFPSEMEKIAKADPWKRQQMVLQKLDEGGLPVIINALQTGGVSEGLISKITGLKQKGLRFSEIIKNLSPNEAKMAMEAIQPPSLVQHEVQRITPGLMGR